MNKKDSAKLKQSSKFELNSYLYYPIRKFRLKKKFDNAIKEMDSRHNVTVSQLDSLFEKTISNRPRYQPVGSLKGSLAENVMYSSMRSMKMGNSMARASL